MNTFKLFTQLMTIYLIISICIVISISYSMNEFDKEIKVATKPANAEQKRFMSSISDFINENGLGGLYGPKYEKRRDFQLHHVLGRSAKHNKVAIGHWFIIPVPFELHDVSSNHQFNVTHHKKAFVKEFGQQCGIFQILYSCMDQWNRYHNSNFTIPSMEVYNAIMDTRA